MTFEVDRMHHIDHGHALTSNSSQGITADRVLVKIDTKAAPTLIHTRFAYVAVSRAAHDVRIYTNDSVNLRKWLSHEVGKPSALQFVQTCAGHRKPLLGLSL